MSEVELTQQLDQAIEALLSKSPAATESADRELAQLLALATGLRDLPRPDFRARLRQELEEVIMSTATKAQRQKDESNAAPIREGFRPVTPYVVVSDVPREIDFIRKVFG